ncbi:MAG: ribonucleoside triphosphate reductase [candidate division WOR-3 bacterium]|nr:ribonucleoside triphosphate reductase [candidate division WOR-3 bacterium]
MSEIRFIRKRDGRLEEFDEAKITSAIYKAVKTTGEDDLLLAKKMTNRVVAVLEVMYKDGRVPTVENVQDLVEKMLIESSQADIAKAYILYRQQHADMRSARKMFDEGITMMDDYIQQSDWRVNENSNMSYSLQGLNNHISSSISAMYWLEKIYPKEVARAHRNSEIHIHDLGMLSVYCCGWDLEGLLLEGLGGVTGKIESSPPKHFRTALGQIVNYFYTLQGEAAGAQAFSSFDTYLAPFIRFDELSHKQVKQAMQEFIFNVNVPTRVGFQTPFTNITMDLMCPKNLRDDQVIIGGKRRTETYKEFQREMDLINTAFAEVMMEGDEKGRIFTFPIPTYNITKDFDWHHPAIEKVWEMTAKYGIPYFSNFINSDMDPSDARSMCCRLRLDNRELKKRSTNSQLNLMLNPNKAKEENTETSKRAEIRGGGLFGANPMTGSVGVVTINIPRLAYNSRDKNELYNSLSRLMEIAKESLEIKRKVLERFTENGLYPYSKHYLRNVKKSFGTYWANHFSTIGLIGVNEASMMMLGKNIGTEQGREFALETLKFMKERLSEFSDETGNLYNLEASPAEGTSYRLAKADREEFPEIMTSGNDNPYYTNSTQLPVGYTDDLFEALSLQDEIQCQYTGGTVLHGFLGERIQTGESAKILVKKIAENFHLPYFTLTPTFSICPVHGYISGEHEFCPYDHSDEELEKHGVEIYEEKGE